MVKDFVKLGFFLGFLEFFVIGVTERKEKLKRKRTKKKIYKRKERDIHNVHLDMY